MLKGVVLAAGAGTRLRPMTLVRPKALTPVGGRPLLEWAVERVRPYVGALAVNVHHHPHQVVEAVARLDAGMPVHVSLEQPVALGTAGALGALRDWVDGHAVLLTNADAWYPATARPVLDAFVAGWDGERPRLLCVRNGTVGDFGPLRYVGTALLPWTSVADLPPRPAGLYEASWAAGYAAGGLDLVEAELDAVDCGTPADLARARRLAREVADPSGE